MKTSLSILLCTLFFLPLHSKEVTLTNKEGKGGSFTLISLNEGTIEVTAADRKSYQLKLADLDEASNKAIQKWVAEGGNLSRKIEIAYNSGKRASVSKNEGYDDKAYVFNPEVILKNNSQAKDTSPLRISIALLGRPVQESTAVSVKWVELADCTAIEPMQEKTIKFSNVQWEYDNRGYAQYGSRYLGYLVVVKSKTGKILASKSLPEKTGERLLPMMDQILINDKYDKYGTRTIQGHYYYFQGNKFMKSRGPRHGNPTSKGKGKGRGKGKNKKPRQNN